MTIDDKIRNKKNYNTIFIYILSTFLSTYLSTYDSYGHVRFFQLQRFVLNTVYSLTKSFAFVEYITQKR